MKRIAAVLAIASAVMFCGRASALDARDGKAIITISADPNTNFIDYVLFFQSADGHGDSVRYGQHNWLFHTTRDFDDDTGNGVVKVLELRAGQWTISSFLFTQYGFMLQQRQPMTISFTVKPGQTTYIGDYRVHVGRTDRVVNGETIYRVVFNVSDQSARDIAIAQRKDKDIAGVEVAIPDIPPGTPYFIGAPKPAPPPAVQPGAPSKTP